jgi:hypothetical protein
MNAPFHDLPFERIALLRLARKKKALAPSPHGGHKYRDVEEGPSAFRQVKVDGVRCELRQPLRAQQTVMFLRDCRQMPSRHIVTSHFANSKRQAAVWADAAEIANLAFRSVPKQKGIIGPTLAAIDLSDTIAGFCVAYRLKERT